MLLNMAEATDDSDKKIVKLDDVLMKFKLFGRHHLENFMLIFFAFMTNSMYGSNYVFVAERDGYRCKDPHFSNSTCSSAASNVTAVCTEWEYDNPHSFVAEMGLACAEWKRTLVGTSHSVGLLCGLMIVGIFSDRYGRKTAAVVTGVLGGILGLSRSFTTNYWLYIALEFATSAFGDVYSPLSILVLEMVPSNRRIIFYTMCGNGYTFGSITLALIAWLVPYWRNLLRVIHTPALVFFLYVFLLEESPRWLLSKGKKEKAVAILEKVARKNKVKLDKSLLDNLSYDESKGVTFLELLKMTFASRVLLKRFFICIIWWIASIFVTVGLLINSVSLPGNKYLNFALTATVNIPGKLIDMAVLYRFKRKWPLMFSFTVAAIFCSIQPFVPLGLPWLSMLLYMLGKLMSSLFFTTTKIFTSELFPTYTRNSMVALCSSLGKIGSIMATQTPLLTQYWDGLPTLAFAGVSLLGPVQPTLNRPLAAIVTLFVSDASDDALPDTVKQAEAQSKPRKRLEEQDTQDKSKN